MVTDGEISVRLQVLVQTVAYERGIHEREARGIVLRLLSDLCVSEQGYGGIDQARRIMARGFGRGRR